MMTTEQEREESWATLAAMTDEEWAEYARSIRLNAKAIVLAAKVRERLAVDKQPRKTRSDAGVPRDRHGPPIGQSDALDNQP